MASPHPSEVAVARAAGKNLLIAETPADYARVWKLFFVKPPQLPGPVLDYLAERAAVHKDFAKKLWSDLWARPDPLDAELSRVKPPTLVLWGDADRVIDVSSADVFAQGIPGAKLVKLERCGHVPMAERPEETAKYYLAFLSGLPGASR